MSQRCQLLHIRGLNVGRSAIGAPVFDRESRPLR